MPFDLFIGTPAASWEAKVQGVHRIALESPDIEPAIAVCRAYAACMPSLQHEALIYLFRNRPALAPELLRGALRVKLPFHTEVEIDSADLGEVQPAEYRADLVVLLKDGVPVFGIVVEAQLQADPRKRYVWPSYVTNLRARLECPVCLLVVTVSDRIARWAAKPIELGGGNGFVPLVVGPSAVPAVSDPAVAAVDPELAVLSVMAHGRDADIAATVRIAVAAQAVTEGLDEERSRLYLDLILASLSEAARRELQSMDPAKYEYQSEFARRYVAQGRAEGRAELVIRLLSRRFGPLPESVQTDLSARSVEDLDAIGERLLSAQTLQEALGSH